MPLYSKGSQEYKTKGYNWHNGDDLILFMGILGQFAQSTGTQCGLMQQTAL